MATAPPHRRRTAARWAVVAVAATAASAVFAVLALPSPVLFGSLLGGMVYALAARTELDMPPLVFRLGQALVGVVIGALVKVTTLSRLVSDWPSVLLVTVGTLVISVVAGRLLALHRDVSPATGAFALVAGGASGIVALARELGADDRVVTVVQYLRVLLVLLAMPLVTSFVFHPPSGRGEVRTTSSALLPDLVFVVVAVVLGLAAQRVVHAPAAALLAPMLVAVAISASGVLGSVAVPGPLEQLGYALIGVRVGLRFTRASLTSIAQLLPLATALILLVIVGCGLLGLLLSEVTGVDRLTAYLATTPGGLFAVLATAADSGSDVTYVLAIQVIRVFAMLLLAPLLGRWLRRGVSRGRTRCPRGPA
jgi:membrane AbrB-like protein